MSEPAIRQLSQRKGNYPNHPLFRIAPLLDSGFQTVNFDPYERVLVAKIRDGRYTTDLFDCNSLLLDYGARLDRFGASPAERQGIAIQSRYKMTPEQLAEYRHSLDENDRALKAQREAERKAKKAEQERVKAEDAARRTAREAELEKRAREWGEEEARREVERDEAATQVLHGIIGWRPVNPDRVREQSAILRGHWECASCLRPAQIDVEGDAYILECRLCKRSASADHATLVNIMLARQARHSPANST